MITEPYSHIYYVADGETATFSYPFECKNPEYIKVATRTTDGIVTTDVPVVVDENPDHTLIGTITFEPGTVPENGTVILIERWTPRTQDTSYRQATSFNTKNIEASFDKAISSIQELNDKIHKHTLMQHMFQDEPFTMALLADTDDTATMVIDWQNKKIKRGLYFKIEEGILKASTDGQGYISMPKSEDIKEIRQQWCQEPPHYYYEYRVAETWFQIDTYDGYLAKIIAEEAKEIASAALKVAQRAAGETEIIIEDIAGLRDELDNHNTRINQNESDITDLKVETGEITTTVGSHETRIKILEDTPCVNYVNGKTGEVVLTGEDISADVDEQVDTVQGHLQTLKDSLATCANVSLNNLDAEGEARFDAKQNKILVVDALPENPVLGVFYAIKE